MNLSPQDIEVAESPSDGISQLKFSPQADMMAASSWDGHVRIYEILGNRTSRLRASYSHTGPVLCCAWSKDGTKLASGGADNIGMVYDLTTGQCLQVAHHDGPIKEICWIESGGPPTVLATGSWDKTVRYWDLRQPNVPVTTVSVPERVYAMDSVFPILVTGTADQQIQVYHLQNPSVPLKTVASPLRWQTRTISCYPDGKGYAVGSIEGRVGMLYVEDKDQGLNFTFRCHREEGTSTPSPAMAMSRKDSKIYSVNCINWHPVFGSFSTVGSDGTYAFWDRDARQKLKSFPKTAGSISSSCFNRSGSIFAYAKSYEWNKGHTGALDQTQNKIMLHAVNEVDVKPRRR